MPASQLARGYADRGHKVLAWDPDPERAADFARDCGARAEPALPALVDAMAAPRLVWVVSEPARASVCLDPLVDLLSAGDLVLQTGLADIRHLASRARDLDAKGVRFADVALVAGDWGGNAGRLLAVGTPLPVPEEMAAALNAVAGAPQGAWLPCGPPGSGFFAGRVAAESRGALEDGMATGFQTLGPAGMQPHLGELVRVWQRSGERNAALGVLARDYLDAIAWDSSGKGVPPPAVNLAMSLRFAAQGLELYLAQLQTLMGGAAPGPGPSR